MTNRPFPARTFLLAAIAVVVLAVAGVYVRDSLFPNATPTAVVVIASTEPTRETTAAVAPTATPAPAAATLASDRATPTRFFTT